MENWKSEGFWIRTIYMMLFYGLLNLALMAVMLIVVVHWIATLVTGERLAPIRGLSAQLSTYIEDLIRFLTFQSQHKPFPFTDWPSVKQDSSATEQ